MAIAPLLKRFVSDELARSADLIAQALAGTLTALRDSRSLSGPPVDRAHIVQAIEALQRNALQYQKAFVDALRAQVIEGLKEQQDDGAAASVAATGGLQLMDESRVEEDIEISRAMRVIDTVAEWELRELQTFTSTLIGQTHVSAESNPLRPLMYATALWQAACVVTPVPLQRAAVLRASAGALAALLKNAWAAACTRLESQGIEPGIYRTTLLPGSASAYREAPTVEAARATAMGGLLASMPSETPRTMADVDSALDRATRMGGRSGGGPGGRAEPFSPELEAALLRLDELLRPMPAPRAPSAAPVGGAASSSPLPAATGGMLGGTPRLMGEHRAALLASASDTLDRQTIELMSRLFEVILSDLRLPEAFRSVVARLQGSALRVALRDPSMMESPTHPVWQLVDRIGTASTAYSHVTDKRLVALLAFCQAVAEDLARAGSPDATLYTRALARVEAFLGEQFQWQLREAQPTIEALERAERRDILEQHLAQRLAEQMAPMRTPPAVRRFVGSAWARVMAESMLRFGEDAEPTRGYIKAVDELLWSVQLPDHPQSRQRLLALLPNLLQRIRAGMASIALPDAEQQAVLDELMAIHTEALRPGGSTAAAPLGPRSGHGTLTPAEIVQGMRDEVLPERDPYAPPDSVIDLGSMETVPAELMMAPAPPRADTPERQVDAMTPAAQYRMFVQRRWQRVQLLWRSAQGRMFLFTSDNPQRRHSITRRALERLTEAGLVQPPSQTSLTQRAVEVLVRQQTLPK